ncbi:MAG: hypothetical protein R2856_10775 [Caldilineaceae bacterium]
MARLDQLFDHFGDRLVYHIELKGRAPGTRRRRPRRSNSTGRKSCFITSFSSEVAGGYAQKSSSARLELAGAGDRRRCLDKSQRTGLHQLCPQAAVVTAEMVTGNGLSQYCGPGASGTPRVITREVIALIEACARHAGCDGA